MASSVIAGRLALLSAAAFATMAALRVCDALLPSLASDFGATSGQAGQTVSAFAIAYGLALLLYGPLGDRHDKFNVAAVATLTCTVGSICCALAPSLKMLIVFRAGWGVAAAGVTPLAMAWIGDTVPYERRQEVLAHLIGATTLGLIAGQSLGGVLADTLGWRSAFWALAFVFAVTGTMMCVNACKPGGLGREARSAGAGGVSAGWAASMRSLFADPWARRVLIFSFVEGVFVFGGLAFLPSHLHQRFGLSMTWAGAVLVSYGAGGVVYSRIARPLLRRLGQTGLARAGGTLMCVYFASLCVLPAWGWALPACLAGGLGFYMLHGTLQAYATQMMPSSRGTAMTLFSSCLFMGNSAGVAMAALLVDRWSATAVFMVSALALPIIGWSFAAQAGATGRRVA
ncbi:MAG TPA: MFS transporter [Ramlibacter sp.]|nr:MFS transporter [Ramlibacter sp.]